MRLKLLSAVFFLIALFLPTAQGSFAQQPPAPVSPTDTVQAADSVQAAPEAVPEEEPLGESSAGQFLLPPADGLDTEHGYNLKVTVRMAPVYDDSTLVSEITGYLPQGSVVGVLTVLDNWYRIEYGTAEDRKDGWLISYGVERTHEMEHVVTSRDDQNRWEGQRVVVVSGETPIRSFPSSAAEILIKAYRNEIFNVSGASEDYYMVKLSNAVNGWVWRGDVDIYEEPKYTKEQIKQMYISVREHKKRIADLQSLISDLESRSTQADSNVQLLSILDERMKAEQARLAARADRKPFFQYDSLKHRINLQVGFLRQGFASDLGLDVTMLTGLGLRYQSSEKFAFEFSRFGGDPALLAPGEDSGSLPTGLSGLDSLRVSAKFWQFGARWMFGKMGRVPLLGGMDNYLYGGLGFLTLTPQTAGYAGSQSLWGPILGWGFTKKLFSSLTFDMGLRVFLTQTEVTDVRFSGQQLLQTRSVFLKNIGMNLGVAWRF